MIVNAIAIDDEPLALQVIEGHAKHISFLNLQQVFTDAFSAIAWLAKNKTDVLFVDIKMPDIDGLQLAELFRQSVQIVFTTAYPHYAVKGFDLQATDYLLKPIPLLRFLQACQKVQDKDNLHNVANADAEAFVKEGSEWIKINPAQVLYAEAKGNYLKIVTSTKEYLLRMTFSEMQDRLKYPFLRIHKSYAVNARLIDRIEPHQVTIGHDNIPVGAAYRYEMLNTLGLKSNNTD